MLVTLARLAYFLYRERMPASISRTEKSRGRPKTHPTSIHLTLSPDMLAAVDKFVDDEAGISRPEAVRLILRRWLSENGMLDSHRK